MNQQKIGNFIKEKRKEKELTQEELATKLGVSNRTISKWENGHGMPDYSMILDLCRELDMSINELLSGEEIKQENYQTMLEENIIKTIDYNNRKRNKKNFKITLFVILIVVGLLLIGYKMFYLHLYKEESIANEMVFNLSRIELKHNDKANRDVLNNISIYIPDGFVLENDISKSSLVSNGCALFLKENTNNNFIQICVERESLGDTVGDYVVGIDSFSVVQLFAENNIYNYYDLVEYYLNHKNEKYSLFSKKNDVRLMFMCEQLLLGNHYKHYLHSEYMKGLTTIHNIENNNRLFMVSDFTINNSDYTLRIYSDTLSEDDSIEILSSIKVR